MPTDVLSSSHESRTESRTLPLWLSCKDPQTQEATPNSAGAVARSVKTSRFAGKRIHFIGIGGCGMSGLARMLLDSGAVVTGSEPNPNPQTFELSRAGATISRDQMGELLSTQTDLVVRTAAVPDSNTEFKAARAYDLPTIKYSELLGQVMQERLGVAVAGTHGKSTTTAMISWALMQCGADPSFVIGGTVPQLGGGSRSGSGKAFVVEACEFDRSFHKLRPRTAIITNIEEDHLDCYKDITEIVESFRDFARLVPAGGLLIANGQDARCREALDGLACEVQFVELISDRQGPDRGAADAGNRAKGNCAWTTRVLGIENGCHTGELWFKGKPVAVLKLSVPGAHNLFNGTMAVAACVACGIDPAAAAVAVGAFTGVDRRTTEIGTCNGAVVVDDYGHHPTEIRATLKALRERYHPSRLFCVFQPHQHSRTRFLLDDFATSFAAADQTIVPEIYFVRDSEAEKQRVSASDLVDRVRGNGQNALFLDSFEAIVSHLRATARAGDVIVTMGAGNVWEIARDLAQ